jgi:hypothetical protein
LFDIVATDEPTDLCNLASAMLLTSCRRGRLTGSVVIRPEHLDMRFDIQRLTVRTNETSNVQRPL